MRRSGHAILVCMAALPWLLGVVGFAVAALLVVSADKLWPKSTHGNCWSFAGPRWLRLGGYLLIRWADGARIPHVAIVHKLPDEGVVLEQYMPLKRRRGWRAFLDSIYFRGKVIRTERQHPSDWGGL